MSRAPSRSRLRPVAALGLGIAGAVLAGACSREDPAAHREPALVPAEITALVPEDAVAFVRLAPLRTLEAKWRDLEAATARKEKPFYGLLATIEEETHVAGRLDPRKPLGIAFAFDATGEPQAIFIVPDAKGRYVSLRGGATLDPPAAPSPLAAQVLESDLSVRLDVGAILDRHGDGIESALTGSMFEPPPGVPDSSRILRSFLDGLRSLLDATEVVDFGLVLDGTRVDLVAALTGKARGMFDGARRPTVSPLEIAGLLPSGFPIEVALDLDPVAMWRLLASGQELGLVGVAEERQEALRCFNDEGIRLARHLRNESAGAFRFDEEGFSWVSITKAHDAQTYVDRYVELLAGADAFFAAERLPDTVVEGARVRHLRTRFDEDAFTEPPGLPPGFADLPFFREQRSSWAAVGDKVVTVWGGDEAFVETVVRRVQDGGGRVPGGLARASEKAGPGASVLARFDLRATLKGVAGMLGPMGAMLLASVAEGDPVDLLAWYGAEGRLHRAGLSVDVADLRRLRPPFPR